MSYFYYCESQTPDTKRIPCPLSDIEQIKREKAFHVTLLAVSELAPESWEDVLYKGDWWFDIDHPKLDDAIISLHKLMDVLEGFDVNLEHLRYYASGSKGFHIRVPATLFSDGGEQKHLHKVYKQMALRLVFNHGITGIDMNLYTGKTGHLLRVENKPRPDGRYKVPLTLDEARGITPELYAELTKQPREINYCEPPEGTRAESLRIMYAQCIEGNWRNRLHKTGSTIR
jgi:hypothetical protein